ncbi:divalent-cation tolerance protein CutA [Haladaptatus pallidirubidus]|uniref:Divalent-cation tolerance protein CutA n=1 Tax=Haladaptatus pallidirubidus TaxID=1008152 RepID=A0AAV3UCL0_9EURY|nr:divalent-cation tolerance protein CutA [Haladaptatus pallidirubidus]
MPTAYITAPTDAAAELAELLVAERLAACVNRFPCTSVYRWEDEVVHDEEIVLLAKTTDSAWGELVERVEAEHPYDVPCIERFDEDEMLEEFGAWIYEEVE